MLILGDLSRTAKCSCLKLEMGSKFVCIWTILYYIGIEFKNCILVYSANGADVKHYISIVIFSIYICDGQLKSVTISQHNKQHK